MKLTFDVIVVGAGPAGLAASLYLKRAGKNVLLIDKDAPGGQMLKTTQIENYLGFESINGAELSLKMFNHVKANDVPFEFGEVVSVDKKGTGFCVKTASKEFCCKYVIIATGRTSNKLGVANEGEINGVSYCAVCDGTFYRDKVVGVVGGGNSAYTSALYLSDLCSQVYIFVRNSVVAEDALVEKVRDKDNIVVIKDVSVTEFMATNNKLKGIVLNDGRIIELEGLFVAIGGRPQLDFLHDVSKEGDYIRVDSKMETSVKGMYACGDVIFKDFYQIATAINDGVIAALSIKGD